MVLLLSIIVMLGILITFQIVIYHLIEEKLNKQDKLNSQKRGDIYRQTEALFSIFSVLKPELPLPSMSGYTINPDFAKIIIHNILKSKPSVIVELGSGVSTVLVGYTLKKLNQGKIFSLEHDNDFAVKNKNNVIDHGLQEFVEILYSPLKKWVYNQKQWLWYDTSNIKNIEHIDMLIVDGPPRKIQKMSRYPALPILFEKLSNDSIIIIDDSKRKDMSEMVDLWLNEFKDFDMEIFETKSGCLVLFKKSHKISE